ncbi:hypothetical protein DAERI_080001 [Deinococcus aerius]|uniref:Glycosyl hydrolase family 98 putative carbohydrate-binding module domain-containing protein n=1 Tax=Deinococcus aerius TaxID=200253 RepID=A0A2I9D6Y3_9DEIO|nr:hypothetical protein DAERI_080001 [Deinococcus aerius]
MGGKVLGDGRVLTIGGQTFAKGLGMHAGASVGYSLAGRCSTFSASVGVDDEVGSGGSVVFQVFGDGRLLAESPVRRGTDGPMPLTASLSGVNELRLVATDAGDGIESDHADWGGLSLTCTAGPTPPAVPAGFTASGQGTGVTLNWDDMLGAGLGGYRLERAPTPDGPFLPVTPDVIGASDFEDTFAPAGETSYYRVFTLDPGGDVSGFASASATRPAAPTASSLVYSPMADQPYGVSEAQGRAVNGKLYSFGGFDSLKGCCTPTDRAYVYEPAVNLWRRLPNMPGRGVTHAGMTTDGKSIYYAGGYIANSSWTAQVYGTKAVWRFDLASEQYTRLPDLPVERAAGQLEYLNGRLHYFGGTNLARTQNVGDHYILDLANGASAWITAAPLPNPRHHMGSAVLGGKIYAIGGQHGHDERLVTQATVNAYDPATDTWATLRDLPSARSHISSSTFVLGGRIVVAGGERSHLQNISAVNAYDPATDTWSALTSLPGARASGVAAPLGNGFVYSAGNWARSGWRVVPATP